MRQHQISRQRSGGGGGRPPEYSSFRALSPSPSAPEPGALRKKFMELDFVSQYADTPPGVPYTWRESWILKLENVGKVIIHNLSPRPDNYAAIHASVSFLTDRFKDKEKIPALFKETPVIQDDELKISAHFYPKEP